ncbi:MAG: YdeI/OmpD-associated family protein [Ferruginibacter sp.]
MIVFKTILLKFDKQGEKTGWTYITIPQKIANKLKPGYKRSFRIKGTIDEYKIKSVALLPMGEGDFIMPVNAVMRKALLKRKGDAVKLSLDVDNTPVKISATLLECMEDDPGALEYFKKLPGSHQNYYSKWIESARTDTTKAKRIALAINAFSKKLSFSQMMQLQKKEI